MAKEGELATYCIHYFFKGLYLLVLSCLVGFGLVCTVLGARWNWFATFDGNSADLILFSSAFVRFQPSAPYMRTVLDLDVFLSTGRPEFVVINYS